MAVLDRDDRGHDGFVVDADDHAAVTQPLLDAHAEHRGDFTYGRAKPLQLLDGRLVTVRVDEVGEARQIDEREAAMHSTAAGDGGELGGVHVVSEPGRCPTYLVRPGAPVDVT